MYAFLIILFVFVAILMTITILMQSSKGGGLAASFGGLGGGGVFGPRGAANFLQKATTFLAIAYGLICLLIGFVGRPAAVQNESVIQRGMQQQQQQQQGTPLPVAPIPGEQGQQQQLPQQQLPPSDQNQQGEENPSQ
jgi:preprotein translocase subunit SecG